MSQVQKTCPDCRCPLHAVKILDATTVGITQPAGYYELRYTELNATESLFRSMPISGIVKGWKCPECHRILLYGEPTGPT